MIDELLNVRRRREDNAIAKVGKAQRELDRKQAACRAKERELREYVTWRVVEISRSYQAVHGKIVSRAALDKYRRQMGVLRSRELQLADEHAKTQQAVERAVDDLEHTRRNHRDAHRDVVRLEEYHRRLSEMEERDVEYREEAETEDVVALNQRSREAEL